MSRRGMPPHNIQGSDGVVKSKTLLGIQLSPLKGFFFLGPILRDSKSRPTCRGPNVQQSYFKGLEHPRALCPPTALPVPNCELKNLESRTSEEQYPSSSGLLSRNSNVILAITAASIVVVAHTYSGPPAPSAAVNVTPHHVRRAGRPHPDEFWV